MKKCLIVVDYQVDFVNGSLGFKGAEDLLPLIEKKINSYLTSGDDLIFTYDTHGKNYISSQEGKNLPVEHCIEGTQGHKLYGLEKYTSKATKIFYKPTFPSLELGNFLKEKDYEEIELCGLVSNICVLSNAIIAKAALPEAKIFIDKKATDSFNKELQSKCFEVLEGLQIKIIE